MERYEYLLVKTPGKSSKYKGISKSDDPFALTLMDGMNELALKGWEFIGCETMTEECRSLFRGKTKRDHEYMVYRRRLGSDCMTLADQPQQPKNSAAPGSGTSFTHRPQVLSTCAFFLRAKD